MLSSVSATSKRNLKSNYDDANDTLSATFKLTRLVPDTKHEVDVTLTLAGVRYESSAVTFTTEGGCYQDEDDYDASKDKAFGENGNREAWLNFTDFTATETTLTQYISVGNKYAPTDLGRCVYYTWRNIDHHTENGSGKVYVFFHGGVHSSAEIALTGLNPATHYDFTLTFHPKRTGPNAGTSEWTDGPRFSIESLEISDIEKTSAKATVTVDNDTGSQHTVYLRHYKAADVDDENRQETEAEEPANTDPIEFSLSGLTAATAYLVDASSHTDFPKYRNKTKYFVTDPNKPNKPLVTPGDRQLELAWTKPAGGDDLDYIVQWKVNTVENWDYPDENYNSELSHTITGLTNGTTYDVRVIANTLFGQAASDPGEGTPAGLPDAPKNLEVALGHEKLTLTWEAPEEPDETGGISLVGYKVQWKEDSVTDWDAQTGVTEVSLGAGVLTREITSLTNGTTYDVRVRADNGVTSDNYNWATDDGTPVPDPSVSLVVKERSQTGATLTANIANGNDEDHTVHLRFREKTTTGWTAVVDQTSANDSAEFTLSSLSPGTTSEAQAWLNDDSPPASSDTFEFYTLPTVEDITFSDRERDSAKATVSLAVSDIDDSSHDVHLRYRKKTTTNWTDATDQPATSDNAEFTLGSLDAGTIYEVQAWLDNDSPPADSDTSKTFEFYTLAEVATVIVSDEGQTTAKATVTLDVATEDDTTKTVHLQYREDGTPPGSWVPFTPPKTTTTDSVEFSLKGLKSDTDYRVEAWTEDDFDNVTAPFDTFRTLRPTVSNVEVEDRKEQETATVTVTIDEPNGEDQQVFLRYRPAIQQDWSTDAPDAGEITDVSTSTSTASVSIPDLKSDTLYEVEASLESDYSASERTSFTTAKPTLTGITVGEVMQQSAKATITIQAPNGQSQMIYARFRKVTDPVNTGWPDADPTTSTSTSDTATAPLSNLTSGTKYEAQASLGENFPSTAGVTVTSEPFTTKGPSLTGLTEIEVSLNGAKLKAVIKAPNDEVQTIYYRYRPTSQTDWSTTATDAGSDSTTSEARSESAEIELTGLNSSTSYDVQASLSSDLDSPSADVVTARVTTLTLDPSIERVVISEEKQTTAKATITIASPGTGTNTAFLRFSLRGQNTWSNPALSQDAVGTTATITISPLSDDTDYDAEVSLDGVNFTNSTIIPFSTIPYPSVESVAVTDIEQTTAKVTVSINDEDGVSREVHLRYIVSSENPDWVPDWINDGITTKTDDDGTNTATKDLEDLSSGTTYILQASYDTNFVTGVEEKEFTTEPNPSVGSVEADNVTKTTAQAVVEIANHDDTELTVELRYQVKATTQDWTTNVVAAQAVSSDSSENPATTLLENLTAGTEYVLQASFDSNFPDDGTKEDTFTTKHLPSIYSVRVGNVGRTSARATITIANPDGTTQNVRLQYREKDANPVAEWDTRPVLPETSTNATARIDLSALTANTRYDVQAWLATDESNKVTDTFRTQQVPPPPNNPPPQRSPVVPVTPPPPPPPPSVTGVTFGNITQNSADATVEISNEGKTKNTLRLRYREDGATEWDTVPARMTSGTREIMRLTSLTAGTTHEVQAWLNTSLPASGTQIYKFDTLDELAPVPDAAISNLKCENIGQTSATAMVVIADAGTGMKEVFLKHSMDGTDEWTQLPFTTITYADSTSINLTGLQVGMTYQVAVALSEDFSGMVIEPCTTLPLDPVVSGISVDRRKQTSVWANISIANANGEGQTVHLRYRTTTPQGEWSDIAETTTSTDSASKEIAGLTADTEYEVQASLDGSFPDDLTKNATSTTLRFPSISNLEVEDETKNSATAVITIADPDGSSQTVHLRYRTTTPQGEWGDIAETTTSTDSASKEIAGLTADTEYEVQASLDGSFPDELTKNATFTTLRFPSISNLEVEDETKNSATAVITIADPDGSSQTIHLRHRTTTPQGVWNSTPPGSSTTSEASIALTGLVPDTEYETEVSLTSDFAVSETDTFRTLPPDPVVSGISVDRRKQTSVWANISIANANDEDQTVHLRYRTTTPRGDWIDDLETTSDSETASKEISGLTAGTEYDVQASLDDSFPSSRTKLATFTTLRWPSIASFEEENVGRNGATVIATIADSHGVAQTVYVRHRATGYIAWRPTQQVDSVDDIASVRMRGLSSGTEYVAEASLDELFPSDETKSVTFTTAKRDDDDDASSSGSGIVQAARAVNIPLLGFSPQMLRFVAIEGRDNPAPQTFLVWNRAQGAMSFNLSNHEEWLSQQPMSGVSNGPDDPVTITASVDSSELASGQYVDVINIDVTSSDRSPGQVIVVLDVMPPDYIRQFVSRDEGGVVVLPDGTVKIIVQPLSPPRDVDIELMKVNLQAHGQPPGEQERVVVAIESNTYEPGGDTPEDVAYTPVVELWVQLPQEDTAACDESRARVYSVKFGAWSLLEHRCETDESGHVWAVTHVERLGAFALVIDDAPVVATPTPVAAAVAATPTAIPASAPAVAVQRISLPAQPPTPTPNAVPTAVPAPVGKRTVAPAMEPTPTPTSVPGSSEPPAPVMQASVAEGGSGTLGRIVLATLGAPLLIGALIVAYLLYRERRRRGNLNL